MHINAFFANFLKLRCTTNCKLLSIILNFQVTCDIVEPRPSRPNEGRVSIAVHLSPMAASHFEQGKGNDLVDQIQQVLDRNIKESRCIDTEALCILAEESVWQLKLDITVS